MTDYAKGSKPQNLDAACGGVVLGKISKFSKDHNEENPMGTGQYVGDAPTDMGKSGSSQPHAKRTGDKCLPTIKPRQ